MAMLKMAIKTACVSSRLVSVMTDASHSVQTVASAAEELAVSVKEINRQAEQSTAVSHKAMADAAQANSIVSSLTEAASQIGTVVNLIKRIADQTNLLALNATIEAARAGDAGRGFAVVASEVKHLAKQTASATEDISRQIAGIQTATHGAVTAIDRISSVITEINQTSTAIAISVDQQGAATQQIAQSIQTAARGVQEASANLPMLQTTMQGTRTDSEEIRQAAVGLSALGDTLNAQSDQFITNIRTS